MIAEVQKQMKNQDMELEVTEAAKAIITKEGYEPKYGARPLRRSVQRLIENPLSNEIIEGKFKPKDKVRADAKEGAIFFEKTGTISPPPAPEKPAAPKVEEPNSNCRPASLSVMLVSAAEIVL